MQSEPTDDFRKLLDERHLTLARAIAEGFTGVNYRLDRLNGRVDKHDDVIAAIHVVLAKASSATSQTPDEVRMTASPAALGKVMGHGIAAVAGALVLWLIDRVAGK